MPRRNFYWLIAVAVVSLVCYQKVQGNRYGRIFADALSQVERRYIKPVDAEELFEGAMKGMMSQLDDPNSQYERPVKLKDLRESLHQEFGGVGIQLLIEPETGQLTVISPLARTPAWRAGIRAGDKILRIDGVSTRELSQEEAIKRMRGNVGEPVVLTVLHEGEEKPADIRIVREKIQDDSVLGDTRNPDGSWNFFLEGHEGIGYVRIKTFGEKTVSELEAALNWLKERHARGLVLDLRNNPGGYLNAAVGVCDLFLDEGEIVSTRARDKEQFREVYTASGKAPFGRIPLAVLVNHFSASASEIVAACLQDHHRAVVVGERTWGKGTVQEVIELEGNHGALRLTTAEYLRPSKKNIHRYKNLPDTAEWGVLPDDGYDVPLKLEEFAKLELQRLRRDLAKRSGNGSSNGNGHEPFLDPQVAKAVEYIEGQLTGEKSP